MSVNEDVTKVIKEFNKAKRYIGISSTAAIVIAKVLGKKSKGPGVQITLGCTGSFNKWPLKNAIKHAKNWGNMTDHLNINEVSHDHNQRIVSTPASLS